MRLRKVSGSMPLPTGPSSNNMEGSTLQRRGSLPALRKVGGESSTSSLSVSLNGKRRDNPEAHAGEKRKRGDERDLEDFRDDLRATVKQRSFASASSDSSFASTSASTSFSLSQSQSQSHPLSSSLSRALPPSSLTDGATPSLCSDNEVDREDERLPSTPPLSGPPFRNVFRFKEAGIPVEEDSPRLGPDHPSTAQSSPLPIPPTALSSNSAQQTPPPSLPATNTAAGPTSRPNPGEDPFAKRPPTSPLPLRHSPRKPRPPARTSGSSRPFPPTPHPVRSRHRAERSGSDEEDPLSLTYPSSPDPEQDLSSPTLSTSASARGRQKQKQKKKQWNVDAAEASSSRQRHSSVGSSHSSQQPQPQSHPHSRKGRASSNSSTSARTKRRLTLDEELRDSRLFGDGDENGEESGVLMGFGTRSKKLGFLAHGGAGGAPVFMGVGYVEGAEEDSEAHYGGGVTVAGAGVENEDDKEEEEEEQLHGEDEDEYRPRTTRARRPGINTAAAGAKRGGRR